MSINFSHVIFDTKLAHNCRSSSDEEVQELSVTFTRAARVSMLPPSFTPSALDGEMEDVKPYIRGNSVAQRAFQLTSPLKPPVTPHRPSPTPAPHQPAPAPPSPPPQSPSPGPSIAPPSSARQIVEPQPIRPPRPPDAAHPPVFLSSSPSFLRPPAVRKGPGFRRGRGRTIIRSPSPSRSPTIDPNASSTLPSPHRYPTPPPFSNLTGPSATYPYIPPTEYSARPGGPRIYDLLNSLSLEPFGLMSWYIIDQEESIFEFDDARDEDKVMQALWLRWIILNRLKFIENYFMGAKAFIDEYWLMIHRAAGFSALRVWLLVWFFLAIQKNLDSHYGRADVRKQSILDRTRVLRSPQVLCEHRWNGLLGKGSARSRCLMENQS